MLDYSKEYGPHSYPRGSKHKRVCKRGCGCALNPDGSSSGPPGLDPSKSGECPKNPKDGELLGGKRDREAVFVRRILSLEHYKERARKAESLLSSTRAAVHSREQRLKVKEEAFNQRLSRFKELVRDLLSKDS